MLLRTIKPILVSGLFTKFSDRREVQAVLPQGIIDLTHALDPLLPEGDPCSPPDPCQKLGPSGCKELWIDYVADTGDGFDATATVASVVAEPTLKVGYQGGTEYPTVAGPVLILGGDEVYPTASVEDYEGRFLLPFREALPASESEPLRRMLAIPGNHDWYDGLTAFLQVFCARQWIGRWKTVQRRSYFACRLPQRWWLWAVDIQLDTYIDQPQLDYFRRAATQMADGDALILCWAKPTWVDGPEEGRKALATLDFFQRRIIPEKVNLRVSLTGDSHHYARYEGPGNAQKITAGLGGAFLSATHTLPTHLHLPPHVEDDLQKDPVVFTRQKGATYPSVSESKKLAKGVLSSIYLNDGFAPVIAGIYAAFALSWHRSNLAVVALVALVLSGCIAFTKPKKVADCWLGGLHGFAQLGSVGASIWAARQFSDGWAGVLGVAAVGAALGPLLVASYLLVDGMTSRHNTNELFAAQAIEDYKGFLRLHIAETGLLTIYPIKIDKVARWEPVDIIDPLGNPQFQRKAGSSGSKPELIEEPIQVPWKP